MLIFLLQALAFLAQTADGQPEVPWWLAAALGPTGLTVCLLFYAHTLRKENREQEKEIRGLNEERRKDLVSGMLYREAQQDKLLENSSKERDNLAKLGSALTELGRILEKNNESTEEVTGAVQDLKLQLAAIQGRLGNSGGSTTDLR
jgi:CRISPR/Cas system CSM-associated protein Csm2 small subunit